MRDPIDMNYSDYGVLAALRRVSRPYRLTPSRLYGRLQRSSGGMTKILKRLEERGLVERAPDPEDGRGSVVSLTIPGREVQERIFNAFLAATDDVVAMLPESRRSTIDSSLGVFLDAFEEYFEGSR